MEKLVKTIKFLDLNPDQHRQYIDAKSVFTAWEEAKKAAAEVRGSMCWRTVGNTEYLIRRSSAGAQKSLGPRAEQTEAIFTKFTEKKTAAKERLGQLTESMTRHQKLNRALDIGRTPQILVDILNRLEKEGLSKHFMVIGTHALYAYEAAAGVRIAIGDALATNDIDLLWDTRKRLQFVTHMKSVGSSMLNLLKKVDPTFELRRDQLYTAVNGSGYEVDIIRRMATDGDPHPLKVTDHEDDFYAVQTERASVLLDGKPFSSMIVSPRGTMARMNTVSPVAFAKLKRWMAGQANRDPQKRGRDELQAELVEQMVEDYFPQLVE